MAISNNSSVIKTFWIGTRSGSAARSCSGAEDPLAASSAAAASPFPPLLDQQTVDKPQVSC